jgi:uncharacterized protein
VDEIIKTQEPDGYISMMTAPDRMKQLWDIHEMGYLVYGLTSDYRLFGEKRSLEAARKLADYIVEHWTALPADWDKGTHIATHVSVTGVERTMLTLYGQTGDKRYLDFCLHQRSLPEWDLGIVVGRREGIEGHVFAYLARCLGQLELYRTQADDRLLQPSKRALQFMTSQDGMSITGGVGQWEIWTDDQDGRNALGETCATAYQLRVCDSLLRLEGDSRCGDLMERMICNALFAAQSPDGRRIRYYSPLEGRRDFFELDSYCCPCNFRRIVADLPSMIYYRCGQGVAVNLYTASEASVGLDADVSLKIRQETDYPTSGRVTIRLDPSRPARFPLQLRIPRWCGKPSVAVNGKAWEAPITPGAFLPIERQWTAGDIVTLEMPMPWRLVLGRKRQSGRVAVMRGPQVFCLNPAQNKSLAGQDAADLGGIMLYPTSLKTVPGGDAVRPGGVTCGVTAGSGGYDMFRSGDLSLRLTEFPDPEGKVVYFRVPDLSAAVPDELLGGK